MRCHLCVAAASAFILCTGAHSHAGEALRWGAIKLGIRAKFPQVAEISTEELAGWLADKRRTPPLLLDVREREEFAVSHLKNARHITPDADVRRLELPAQKSVPVVTYCSVGYRSAALALRLQQAGYTNVRNLEGSIFQWANEGRPMVNERGARVTQAHPYDASWGKLLDPERRAPVAQAR